MSNKKPKKNDVAKYIYSPHKTGVYHTRIAILEPRTTLKNLEKLLPTGEQSWWRRPYYSRRGRRRLEEIEIPPHYSLIGNVNAVFTNNTVLENSRKTKYIAKWIECRLGKKNRIISLKPKPYDIIVHDILNDQVFSYDNPLEGFCDTVHISEQLVRGGKLLVDICSIKKVGVKATVDFIFSLPKIKENSKIVWKDRKAHASHWSTLPLIGAIRLWLMNEETTEWVPDYLSTYLLGSVRYFLDKEWRPSIVLSAIAVETLLADIYEEETHSPAPDVPLGALKDELKKITRNSKREHVLKGIERTVNTVNEMRIAAVHRGTRKVSNEEAYNALTGASKFILWYFYS